MVQPGWLAVYGKDVTGEEPTLTPVKVREVVEAADAREGRGAATRRFEGDEQVATEKVDVVALTTRPPPRFNEGTLLSAMEGAGKSIEDDELREAMREKGLGTPATRAQIIEGLIFERYILREGKELIATPKAASLMTLLHGLGIPELFSPELTAEWEFKLAQMEHGKLKRSEFMREIIGMTKHIVAQAKNYESDTIPGDFATLTAHCPKCGGEVHEKYKRFQCLVCDFGFWKIMGGRQIEPAEADTLLSTREVGPLDGFRSRIGRPFSAKLKLTDANEVEFDFGPRADDDDGAGAGFLGADAARTVSEMRQPRVRDAQRVRVRARSRRRAHVRFPFGTDDPPAADRARADVETARDGQDGPAAVRIGANAPAVFRVPRQAGGRQGRIRVRGEGSGAQGCAPARERAAARAGQASARSPADRTARGALRSVRQARHDQRDAARRDKVDSLTLDEAMALVDEKAGRSPARTPRRTVEARARRARRRRPPNARRATATRRTRTAAGNGAAAGPRSGKTGGEDRSLAHAQERARRAQTKTPAVKKTLAATRPARRRRRSAARRPRRQGAAAHGGETTKRAGARTRK